MSSLTVAQKNLFHNFNPPTNVLGNIYCDKCQVTFKNKNKWLSHMKSSHRTEFNEIVSEQRLKRDIFNKNLDLIKEDMEDQDDPSQYDGYIKLEEDTITANNQNMTQNDENMCEEFQMLVEQLKKNEITLADYIVKQAQIIEKYQASVFPKF